MLANIIRNRKKTGIGGGGGGIVIDNGDPFYSAVSLLLPMDGTNGSTTFTDSGPNGLTVTAVGNTQISTSQSKYGGASGFFDGTGDYLSIAANAAINLSSSDFTIEFWIRPAPKTNAVDAAFGYSNYACMFYHNGTNWTLELSSTGFSNQLVISCAVTLNDWQHIAIVRSGSSIVVYKDGISSATGTFSGTVATSGRNLRIGDNGNSQNINGFIDDFRITNGYARYTSNFTPPTAALPTTASSTPADPYYGQTSLLLHMDGANGSTTFTDNSSNALAVTVVGNAQITSSSQYGTGAGSFDGTNSYIQVGTSNDSKFLFGTGDFTIEFWCYVNAFSGTSIQTPINNYGSSVTGWNIQLNCVNTNNVRFTYGDATLVMTASNTISPGQWNHVAVTRSGTTARIWINGVASATATNSTNISAASTLTIARGATGATQYFNGKLDDLRITKYARYTSAFAPPAQAHPNIYNPYTTLPVSGAALWLDSSQQNTIFTDAGTTPVTTSGQSIYQWNDLSGNNRHAVQATSGNRPTWLPPASGQNGFGVTSFNGSNNFFVGQWQNFTDLTLFIVARNTNAYSPGGRIFSQSDDTYADNVQTPTTTYIPAAVASTSQFLSTNISQQVILSVSFPNNTYQRFIHRRTGTTGSNTVGATTIAGTIGTVTRNMTRYCMGRTTNGTDGNWAGQICEVIAFPRQLTSGEEASINSYLNTKWGTP